MTSIFSKVKQSLGVFLLVLAMTGGVALVPTSATVSADAKSQALSGVNDVGGTADTRSVAGTIQSIINLLLFLIGSISVIMIIIGGIRFTTSNGDPAQAKAAQNTVLYALVGLVVAIMAFAVVKWVIARL